jgi:hypothetical protein
MKKIIALKNFFQLFFLITLIAFNGCTNNDLVNSNIGGYEYSLNVVNYSDQHFFLDTAYKSNFKDFSVDGTLDNPENIARQVSNDNFEVWIQTNSITTGRRYVSLLIDLPPIPASGFYDTSFYRAEQIQGKRYFGIFRKLLSTEFLVNNEAGYVSLKVNINNNDYIGVSYKETGTGRIYGKNSITYDRDTLILKMIKAGNVNPQHDTLAWAMKLRNIYRLPVSGIVQTGFEFKTYYISPLTLLPSAYLPGDGPLIEALGLGQYIPPDITIFNYIPGRTVIPETGDIIFPTLEPFNTTVDNASGGDTSLAFKDLYTKLKSEAHISPKANLYWLKGKVISPGSIAQ